MRIKLHRDFEKGYKRSLLLRSKKLRSGEKKKFKKRKDLFLQDEFNPVLNNHPLKGKYRGYRSINITGDLRAIYKREGSIVIFVAIDIHSNLYG